jgi:hypothetical protein
MGESWQGQRNLSSRFNICATGLRFGDWLPAFAQHLDMGFDTFTNEPLDFNNRFSCYPQAREVGRVRGITRLGSLNDYRIFFHDVRPFFKPACLRMLLSVPLGTSSDA